VCGPQNTDISTPAFSGLGKSRALKEHWTCLDIPSGVTVGQMIKVVVQYIEAQPKRLHEDFTALAMEAMFDAWPCEN
jgi:hypothetical protein